MLKPASAEPGLPAIPGAHRSPISVRVWDPIVRLFHWGLVLSIAIAWGSAHVLQGVHQFAGYAAASLIATRLLWGFIGTPYARFSQFVRHPTTVVNYLRAMRYGRESRHLGHNPAGGAMVVALLTMTIAAGVTGWMMTTDAFFGVRWVEHLHALTAHTLLVMIGIHVGGVILASYRHRENLVFAMITGRKRRPEAHDQS
jgi:cytochrome b